MRIEPDAANPQGQIDPADIHSPSDIEDSAALQLCVQDAQTYEAWLQNNYWSLRWREADALYQSPPGILMWEGTTIPRANVNRFVVAETVNSIHPQILNGLFYESPSFVLRPRPGQDQNTTRAITELLSAELQAMNFRQEVDWGLFSALNFGTGIWKYGFKSYIKKETKYVRLGDNVTIGSRVPGEPPTEIETEDSTSYKKVVEDKEVHIPTFEAKDMRYVLVDPACRVPDIRCARAVVDRMYMTYKNLEKLADEEYVTVDERGNQVLKKRYKLPSKEEIKSWFEPPKEEPNEPGKTEAVVVQGTTFVHHAKAIFSKTTADPLDEPLEVLERWDNDKVITVLNRVKCIRNEANEFGEIPFLSVNWWNIPDAFWGLGLGRVLGMEQRVQQGLINAILDLASLIVNPMWARARSTNVQEQQIRQRIGGILTLDIGGTTGLRSVQDGLQMIQQPHIPAEVVQQIGLSMQRVERTSGASEQLTMGASPTQGRGGQLGRSGTGAAGIIQATMNRIGGFAEAFVRQVFEPLLYKIHQMNKDKLPVKYIREVLGERLGPEFKFSHGDFLNAPAEFEVLAGSHLAAKAQMAQSLFMMLQLFENAPLMDQLAKVSQKKINIEELFHMVHDLSGFKNYYNIVVDMTDEEKARMAQQANPAATRLQGQMVLQDQKFKQDQQIIDQENESRIVRDIFRHIAKESALPESFGAVAPVGTGGTGAV